MQTSRIANKTVLCYDIHGFRKRQHSKLTFYTTSGQPVAENTFLVSQNSWRTWSQRILQVAEHLLQQRGEGMVRHGRPLLGANPVLPSRTNGLVSINEKLHHTFDQYNCKNSPAREKKNVQYLILYRIYEQVKTSQGLL